jgi:hypothetical protein
MGIMLRAMRTAERQDESRRPTGQPAGDPVISVSMDEDTVVLRPAGRLDRDLIDTLMGLLAGARLAGTVAVVDLRAVEQGELAREELLRAIRAAWSTLASTPN